MNQSVTPVSKYYVCDVSIKEVKSCVVTVWLAVRGLYCYVWVADDDADPK